MRFRDFRGNLVREVFAKHPYGAQERLGSVLHNCPMHAATEVPPFCPVCLGAGLITAERYDRALTEANLEAEGRNGAAHILTEARPDGVLPK